MSNTKGTSEFFPAGGGHGGGHGGGGHHGGGGGHWGGGGRGRWGRGGWGGGYWGAPYLWDYPYYDYPELVVLSNETIPKRVKKVVRLSAEGDAKPRLMNPNPPKAGVGTKLSDSMVSVAKHAGWGLAGAGLGVAVAYFAKQNLLAGAGIGAGLGVGASFIHGK